MSTIRTNEILHSDGTTTNEPSIPALDQRMAKAWVKVSSSFAIEGSYNVSSVTDVSAGRSRVNFTASMADTNYSVSNSVYTNANTYLRITNFGGVTVNYVEVFTLWSSNCASSNVSFSDLAYGVQVFA